MALVMDFGIGDLGDQSDWSLGVGWVGALRYGYSCIAFSAMLGVVRGFECCELLLEAVWRSLHPVAVVTFYLACLRLTYAGIASQCRDADLGLLGVL